MTYQPYRPKERTPEEWEAWWAEFKKRNGIDREVPHPPEDAPTPPPDPRDPETGREEP